MVLYVSMVMLTNYSGFSIRNKDRACLQCRRDIDARRRAKRRAAKTSRSKVERIRQRDYSRDNRLRRYGLTAASYNALLAAQGGVCGICQTARPGGMGGFHVDHDHATNKIRGLLCSACNLGLGKLGDTLASVRRAVVYLENAEAR